MDLEITILSEISQKKLSEVFGLISNLGGWQFESLI